METSSPVPTKHTFYQSPVCVEERSTKSELGGSASVFIFIFYTDGDPSEVGVGVGWKMSQR